MPYICPTEITALSAFEFQTSGSRRERQGCVIDFNTFGTNRAGDLLVSVMADTAIVFTFDTSEKFHMKSITHIIGILLLGSATLIAMPSFAQTQAGQQQVPSATAQSTQNFSRAQLQKFVEAQSAIRAIQQKARPKFQAAESKQAKIKIRQQTVKKMAQAVKNTGLSVEKYNQIARAARSNPQLRKTIQQMQ